MTPSYAVPPLASSRLNPPRGREKKHKQRAQSETGLTPQQQTGRSDRILMCCRSPCRDERETRVVEHARTYTVRERVKIDREQAEIDPERGEIDDSPVLLIPR
jgi:hypothetical protein